MIIDTLSAGAGTTLRFGAWREEDEAVFRMWAPSLPELAIEIDDAAPVAMTSAANGWFEHRGPHGFGTRYRYCLPDGQFVPDPASRRQEGGVHGCSVLTDPDDYHWRFADWRGRPWQETILYEIHAGLLGGFAGVERELPRLAELGITAIELMPIADFPGSRSWGYDGVLQFAPAAAYGTSAELKQMIDRAHELGISVLLDVVFNHFGPDGCYLHAHAPEFFRADSHTPWGAAIDFDRPEVRAFYFACALQWLDEYRFDGLRLDAVHAIPSRDFLLSFNRDVRGAIDPQRHIHLTVENDENDSELLSVFDAQWNDDFHHAVHVLLTGETTTYYGSFASDPAGHLARVLKEGFAFQGEISPARGRPKGKPSAHLPPSCFVNCLQNHDQIGNRLSGDRLLALAEPARVKIAAALLMLNPQIPMLFMGEEFGSRTPFHYFMDHAPELAEAVRQGRKREFAYRDPVGATHILDPNDALTFAASRPMAGPDAANWQALYQRLIALRQKWVIPHLGDCVSLHSAPLGEQCVEASWRLGQYELRLIANFGEEQICLPHNGGDTLFALGEASVSRDELCLAGRAFRAILSPG